MKNYRKAALAVEKEGTLKNLRREIFIPGKNCSRWVGFSGVFRAWSKENGSKPFGRRSIAGSNPAAAIELT